MNRELLAQLRAEVSSDGGESSLSGNEEDISCGSAEDPPALRGQPAQLGDDTSSDASGSNMNDRKSTSTKRIRVRFYGDNNSSSSDDARKLSRLERQRQYTPGSEGSNEERLSQLQFQNAGAPGFVDGSSPKTLELAIRSGEETGSGPDIGSHTIIGLGELASQNLSGESPASVALQIESDGYDCGGLRHQRELSELSSPAIPCPIARDPGFQNSEPGPSSHNFVSSDDEIPRPQGFQRGQLLPSSSASSSDGEGMDDGTQVQPMADQEVGSGTRDAGSFDYRRKLSPLSTQQLRSFVFHDLAVTHHIPRIAIQGFSSLHTSERPSDPRTTKKLMGALTGLEEVRYDCCITGCISYSLPRYNSLEKCPINGCEHARFKADGNPYAQHTYIPITHRLQLMYSDKERAIEMMTYRAKMDEEMETGVCSASAHA